MDSAIGTLGNHVLCAARESQRAVREGKDSLTICFLKSLEHEPIPYWPSGLSVLIPIGGESLNWNTTLIRPLEANSIHSLSAAIDHHGVWMPLEVRIERLVNVSLVLGWHLTASCHKEVHVGLQSVRLHRIRTSSVCQVV
jgi:hypothetical protein